MLSLAEIQRHKELAVKTKKNLKRSRIEILALSISKTSLTSYCDNTIKLCDALLKIGEIVS